MSVVQSVQNIVIRESAVARAMAIQFIIVLAWCLKSVFIKMNVIARFPQGGVDWNVVSVGSVVKNIQKHQDL